MSSTIINGIDYGPLAALAGNWSGDKGLDIAPDDPGQAKVAYFETIMFEAIGDIGNAKKQRLAVLRYHQVVSRKSDSEVFHNETGYWSWDADSKTVMHSLTIPRGLALLAGGQWQDNGSDSVVIDVQAAANDPDWGITQSPFMRENAKTTGFMQHIEINGDTLNYSETTKLDIYGRKFDHIDANTLTRDY